MDRPDAVSPSGIVLERVRKEFPGGVVAVRDISLEVEPGEFVVLVGPSGCGKSTTLRMVAGLEAVTAGEVRIAGRIVTGLAPRHRHVAMVFQNYALYAHMTVRANIGFGLKMAGTPKREIRARVDQAADVLGITDLLDRKPRQLSGGQRQRVAMGRAIVREPAAFLMDEPLSNLDARLRVQMRAEIARIQKMAGVTTIYVTHDQVEAMTMGERVAVLNRGVLQQIGTPRMLYHQPVNLFVASFIGSPAMNLREGRLAGAASGPQIVIGAERIELPASLLARMPGLARHTGRTVVLGVRPEAVRCAPANPPSRTSLMGTVAFTEDLGAALLVHFDIEAPPPRLSLDGIGLIEEQLEVALHRGRGRLRTIVDGMSSLRPGDRLPIVFDLDRLHLFDPATGAALDHEVN
ncbi:MAG: ABC transporter ATP-binding protein [Pseudonocardiaceae bacterium]